MSLSSFAQTTSTVSGSNGLWNTTANWDNGVPAGGASVAIVNKDLILNTNISFGSGGGGSYTINSKVTDLPGGTAYTIHISQSGALIVNGNLTIEGDLVLNNAASLTIESGDTLTIGSASFGQTTTITIKTGGVLIVNGNIDVSNASGIGCDGQIIVNGNYTSSNSSSVTGTGSLYTTGSIITNGTSSVFGSTNECTTGPCSGNGLCGSNLNKISGSQSICSGSQPAQLTNIANPSGTYTIKWQFSTTSGTSGYTDIPSATGLTYQPGTLTRNTWYRRVITQGACNSISPYVQILVGTPIITSQPVDFSICGASGTAKFSVSASGGSQLTYQWKVNGSNVTNGSIYSGATTSTLTVTATTAMNGYTYQCVVLNSGCTVTATSNSVKLIVSNSIPSIPIVSGGSGASFTQITANWAASTNAIGYYLDVATDNGFTAIVSGFNSKNVGNVTSYTVSGLEDLTTYYYRVRAYNSCGLSLNSGVINYSTLSGFTWNGSNNTNWATPANWSGNVIPSYSKKVVIPGGVTNMPVISGNAFAGNLTIQAGATLKNDIGATLSIAGNFTNSGNFIDTGTVVLNGNANQLIVGVGIFNNLTLDNSFGANLSNDVTIKGILTLKQGTLNSNGKLISINLNTGAISGEGSGSITDPIKVYKTVGTKWHHIGNPLGGTNIKLSQLADNVAIGEKSLYYYNETDPSISMDQGWTVIPPGSLATTSMVAMRGYDLYVSPTKTTLDITGNYDHNFSTTTSLTNTSSGEPLSDGWNLLSNPYPSSIDWDASLGWTKTGINGAVYVYDKSHDKYMSYVKDGATNSGSRYIGSMQGFWVKCNAALCSIGINKDTRVGSNVMKLYKGQSPISKIKLSVSSGVYSDETLIRLAEEGTSDFDPSLDAYKFKNFGNNPNISSKLKGVEYSINSISDSIVDELIPLKLATAFAGQYKLNVDLTEFKSNVEVILIDMKSNVSQDLTFESDYTFQTSTVDSNRFYLRLKKKESVSTGLIHEDENNIFIGSDGSIITIRLNTGLTIAGMSINNILGNEVYRNDDVSITGGLIREQVDVLNSGIYILKLKVGNQVYAGRVFLK